MVGHHLALQDQLYSLQTSARNGSSKTPTLESLSPSSYLSTPTSADSMRVGIIEPHCDIEALINNATQSAQFVFFQHYNTVFPPNVHVEHAKEVGGRKVRFPVVPALLHHILFELLKNSMRATAEFHGLDKVSYPGKYMTPCLISREESIQGRCGFFIAILTFISATCVLVDILVQLSSTSDGNLSIKVKDHGGGMSPEQISKPFDYMFTTASNTVCIDFPSILTAVESKPPKAVMGENLPLCGFGFGLATSKLYARLFGGDLTFTSTPGVGTEATISLCRLEDQIEQFSD